MARLRGFEPPTFGSGDQRSIQTELQARVGENANPEFSGLVLPRQASRPVRTADRVFSQPPCAARSRLG